MASGVKRSLFNKPTWAAALPTPASKPAPEESIFGRNTVYEDILAAEERKREKKLARAKQRSDNAGSESGYAKRKRVSVERDEQVERHSDSDVKSISSRSSSNQNNEIATKKEERPVTRGTPQKDKKLYHGLDNSPGHHRTTRRTAATAKAASGLDSDEDDNLVVLTPPKRKKLSPPKPKPAPQLDEIESEEEDEFLQELKQKAREKARLQKLGLLDADRARTPTVAAPITSSSNTPTANIRSPTADPSRPVSSNSIHEPLRGTHALEGQKEKEDDLEVKIMITSSIPDTKPLIAKRKASQSLKQVKEFWCKRNNMDSKTTAQVFFTWKGTRLFDSTTMRGILQKLKNDHGRTREESAFDDGSEDEEEDPSQGRIVVEAMTLEIFEERQREKERKAQQPQQNAGYDSADDDDAYASYDEQEAARARAQKEAEEKLKGSIVVRLVSQKVEPMNLRVRPHTSVAKMMQGFAATRKLEEGKTAWLVFDGERLDPGQTVKDIGLEDEDEIEVHIR